MLGVGRGRGEGRQPGREVLHPGVGVGSGDLEAKPGSVLREGRNPDAQPAGLGLATCCFGDHPDTWGDRHDYSDKPDSFTDPSILF